MKNQEQFVIDLSEAIDWESSKDSEPNAKASGWTPDYRAGYIDGLRRAKELLEDYA